MKICKWTTTLFLTLALVGCGFNDNDDDDNNSNDNPPPADDGGGAAEDPIDLADLQGTWSKRCTTIGTLGFRKDTLTIGATTFDYFTQLHLPTDTDCSDPASFDAKASFTYVVPSFVANGNNNIDMILTTIKAKVNTPAAQVAANAEELCGFTDWQIGIEKDVTGLNCIENLPSSGGDFFQIFFLGDDRLFVGEIDDDHSGETADERPETLEAMPFEK